MKKSIKESLRWRKYEREREKERKRKKERETVRATETEKEGRMDNLNRQESRLVIWKVGSLVVRYTE